VKFIKQVAAEYDFNIAATKSDVLSFRKKQRWFRHYFADPPYALDQKILKNCIINFRKKYA
jgi:16S rRNA G966 N2-methylase RsmD